jgi:hypothetical protein
MAQNMEWEEIKKEMIKQKEQAIRDLGNQGKTEREAQTIRAFLRCLELSFEQREITPVDGQFPDVLFRGANFEVKELMDEGRKRTDEYKENLEAIRRAHCLQDLKENYTLLKYDIETICDKVKLKVNEISNHYSKEARSSANLVIYFNLVDAIVPAPHRAQIQHQLDDKEWQSVSVVGSSWAYIVAAHENAPDYIRANLRNFRRNFDAWD